MALDVATAKAEIHSLFQSLQNKIIGELATDSIPFLGAVATPAGSLFFAALEAQVMAKLDAIPSGADPATSIAAALSSIPPASQPRCRATMLRSCWGATIRSG